PRRWGRVPPPPARPFGVPPGPCRCPPGRRGPRSRSPRATRPASPPPAARFDSEAPDRSHPPPAVPRWRDRARQTNPSPVRPSPSPPPGTASKESYAERSAAHEPRARSVVVPGSGAGVHEMGLDRLDVLEEGAEPALERPSPGRLGLRDGGPIGHRHADVHVVLDLRLGPRGPRDDPGAVLQEEGEHVGGGEGELPRLASLHVALDALPVVAKEHDPLPV